MASGSFEIDTYSWFRSLPLSNCVNGYPQGTMFAVGDCTFLNPYTFYQYQSSVGAIDTSTLSNVLTSTANANLISTTSGLMSSIDYNRRQIVSTIPLMRWISSGTIETYPFTHLSTIAPYNSNAMSTIQSTIPYQFTSSGFFGFITSNLYPSCAPYSLFSTIPVLASTFNSTLVSSISSNYVSTLPSVISSVVVPNQIFNFTSTFSTLNYRDLIIPFSNVWLGEDMTNLIGSQNYNVFVDYQYSIYVSTSRDPVTWVSTFGRLSYTNTVSSLVQTNYPVTSTRIGDGQYSEVHVKQMITPGANATLLITSGANSNFYATTRLLSSISAAGPGEIFVDIFSPGANNYTFTLVPR
jgi:hypothetical protein